MLIFVDQLEGKPANSDHLLLEWHPFFPTPKGELSSGADSMWGMELIVPKIHVLDLGNKNTLHFAATELTSIYIYIYMYVIYIYICMLYIYIFVIYIYVILYICYIYICYIYICYIYVMYIYVIYMLYICYIYYILNK